MRKQTNYEKDLARYMKNKEFRETYDEYGRQLELAIRIADERERAKLSQAALAKKIGTKQSNIARMESGGQNLTFATLDKIARALGRELKVTFS